MPWNKHPICMPKNEPIILAHRFIALLDQGPGAGPVNTPASRRALSIFQLPFTAVASSQSLQSSPKKVLKRPQKIPETLHCQLTKWPKLSRHSGAQIVFQLQCLHQTCTKTWNLPLSQVARSSPEPADNDGPWLHAQIRSIFLQQHSLLWQPLHHPCFNSNDIL